MHLFYTPDITTSDIYILNEEESKHSIRVLRLRIGDKVTLIDGVGGLYEAVIKDDHPKNCKVSITETKKEFGKRNLHLHIAIAPTKNMDRLEWFTEKATEMGIDEITTIDCQNIKRTVVNTERLNKVAISAIKQSLKAYLPKINDMVDFKKLIATSSTFAGQKFIAHCYPTISEKGEEKKTHLKDLYKKGSDAMILIGPEGDFTVEEVKFAMSNGFEEIGLGTSRLRTETAAMYACATVNIMNE
jgi:16S rRNA (uracil1498-N3)-methyltransferase